MTLVKSWVEISGSRLMENLRAVQTAAGVGVETLAVVVRSCAGRWAKTALGCW